jgi:hypothetical protein
MPHCSKMMYSNILKSNWNKDLLKNIWIFGNSFNYYLDELFEKNNFLKNTENFWKEVSINEKIINDVKLKNIFNNTSLHYFDDIYNINFDLNYFKKNIDDKEFI